MPPDSANERIGIFSGFQYRAESLARSIRDEAGWHVGVVTAPDPAVLSSYDIVLIESEGNVDVALDLIRAISARRPQIKVVVLGLTESEQNIIKVAEAGGSGYVPPATSFPGVMATLRAVQKNEFICPPNITYALYTHLARLTGVSGRQSPILTMRERRVLDLLSQKLTNKEIAANLCISEYTAKNHVHRILKKLGWSSRRLAVDAIRRPPRAVALPAKSKQS